MASNTMQQIGGYAFLLGVVIAIISNIFAGYAAMIALALIVLGVIVGILNISDKEVMPFMIASIGLIVAGTANLVVIDSFVAGLGTLLDSILNNIVVFI